MKNENKGNKGKGYITLSLTPRQKMGIYSNGKIFGLRIYHFTEDDIGNTLFEEKYDKTMTHEQMREAYLFFTCIENKNEIFFKIYTECNSTQDIENKKIMEWFPISLNQFLEHFNV